MRKTPRDELRESIRNLNLTLAHSSTLDDNVSVKYRAAAMDLNRSAAMLTRALNTDQNVHNALNKFEQSYTDLLSHDPGVSEATFEANIAHREHQTIYNRINALKKELKSGN